MKAAFRRFFTNSIARVAGFIALLSVLFVLGEIGYVLLAGQTSTAWFSFLVLPYSLILLFLAVLIEYLSRIADALDKPGVLGVDEKDQSS
ncbi:MAG: hypothetical protein JJU18_04145 [Oceanicaulis sp.]|nr:hypothetical protein [Oceanicaulis sp.]